MNNEGEGNVVKGVMWAIAISIPMWAIILWALWG